MSIYVGGCLSGWLSVCLSVCLSVWLAGWLAGWLAVCLCVPVSSDCVCLLVWQSEHLGRADEFICTLALPRMGCACRKLVLSGACCVAAAHRERPALGLQTPPSRLQTLACGNPRCLSPVRAGEGRQFTRTT
jgi:hypothetical protein